MKAAHATSKDTSEKPRSFGLAHPLNEDDRKYMERDVRRNLKLYSVIEALRSGRLPSNAQLDALLGRVLQACPDETSKATSGLSSDTLTTISHFRTFLETLRVVIKEKNADELFQDTIWLMFIESFQRVKGLNLPRRTDAASDGAASPAEGAEEPGRSDVHPIDQDLSDLVNDAAAEHAVREGELAQGLRHIQTLGTIFMTNANLRLAIGDLIQVARTLVKSKKPKDDTLADSATEAAASNDPTNLGTAPETPQAETHDAEEQPSTSPISSPRSHHASVVDEDDSSSMPHVPGAWGDPWSDTDSDGQEVWEDAEDHPMEETLKRIPRLRDFIRHFKAAIVTLQGHPGYAQSMAWLMDVYEAYESEMFAARFPGQPSAKPTAAPPSLTATRNILNNIIILLQRFARGKSVSPIQSAIQKLYEDVLVTPELRVLWVKIDAYLRRVLLETGYIHSAECVTDGSMLYTESTMWFNNTVYWAHWNTITSGLSIWFGSNPFLPDENHPESSFSSTWFRDDPLTTRLEKDWTNLVSSLFLDARKRFAIKRGLWKDLGGIVFPSVQGFGYITFPRVEFVSPNMELVLENVNVSLANILPTYTSFEWHDYLKYSPFPESKAACKTGTHSRIRLLATQIQGEVRDAMIAMKWKKGVTVKDMAMVDVVVSRQGISLDMELEINTQEDSPFIVRATKIEFSLDEVTIVPKGTKSGRDSIYRMLLSAVAIPLLKKKMATKWASKLDQKIQLLNEELLALRERWNTASKQAEKDLRHGISAPGATARFMHVVQERLKELKQKKANQDALTRCQIKQFRRHRTTSDASNRSAPQSNASSAASSVSSTEPPAQPGGGWSPPLKKFRISSRLEDAILPYVSYDKTKSLVWRRRQSESLARRNDEAIAAIKTTTSTVSATATGLSLALSSAKAWRSPLFNLS